LFVCIAATMMWTTTSSYVGLAVGPHGDVLTNRPAAFSQRRLMRSLQNNETDESTLTHSPNIPKIVYAVMTRNTVKKQQLVQAQLDTWAAQAAAQDRFFAVTGHNLSNNESHHHIIRSECDDTRAGLACKEAHIMKTGYHLKADWLVVLGEDNYVDTAQLEHFLMNNSSEQASIMGILGCNESMPHVCNGVSDSLCGGGGYFVSRAALQQVFAAKAEQVIAEYTPFFTSDVATACIFQKHGVRLINIASHLIGSPMHTEFELKSGMSYQPMTLHYLTTPAVMHWVHEQYVQNGRAEEVVQRKLDQHKHLVGEAFKDGRCCYRSQA